jgi:hypothetical protein
MNTAPCRRADEFTTRRRESGGSEGEYEMKRGRNPCGLKRLGILVPDPRACNLIS